MSGSSRRRVTVGVCAMDRKVLAKPMQAILSRFPKTLIQIVMFGEDVILNKPISEWPVVDCLIAFYSKGEKNGTKRGAEFPLEKAEQYVALRRPFCVNNLASERILMDRRKFYATLVANGIEVPFHVIISRTADGSTSQTLVEHDDYIEIDGVRLNKPFVEKPVDAEDHNIYIYYPRRMGGGSKRLFRKVGSESSRFYPEVSTVRTEGSYLYEEFLMTQGTDIKIYAVGPEYAHAEARKSPVVDGVVLRDDEGKEIRYPIVLNAYEKEIARKVVRAFDQNVCGFDLLRTSDKSYICDVNGWSFVKKSVKYYDDCAHVLTRILLTAAAPHRLSELPISRPPRVGSMLSNQSRRNAPPDDELRCVIGVFRHGDRTPKQKLKMTSTHPLFLELFTSHMTHPKKEIKLKTPAQLKQVLQVTHIVLEEYLKREQPLSDTEMTECQRLEQVKYVLERGGPLMGINRKVQLKPTRWTTAADTSATRRPSLPISPEPEPPMPIAMEGYSVATRTFVIEESKEEPAEPMLVAQEVLLVLKWGGTLTESGKAQAEELGLRLRSSMYPGDSAGFVRLHSTYRHDLKIYSSDEGRVQMTAAAFTKGFLALEGELTPILASLVRSTNTTALLDDSSPAQVLLAETKARLQSALKCSPPETDSESELAADSVDGLASPEPERFEPYLPTADALQRAPIIAPTELHYGAEMKSTGSMGSLSGLSGSSHRPKQSDLQTILNKIEPELVESIAPSKSAALIRALNVIGNDPHYSLKRLYSLITALTDQLSELQKTHGPNYNGCGGETLVMIHERWMKLQKELLAHRSGKFDLSKVPDIYDCIKYDTMHNPWIGMAAMSDLFVLAKAFADIVIPQEYGIEQADKRNIAAQVCHHLMRKLFFDLTSVRYAEPSVSSMRSTWGPRRDHEESAPAPAASADTPTISAGGAAASTGAGRGGSSSTTSSDMSFRENVNQLDTSVLDAGFGDIKSPMRHVRTRLYFTSESHVHTLLNALQCWADEVGVEIASEAARNRLDEIAELDYLTHVVFRLYENHRVPPNSEARFRVEILFSPGTNSSPYDLETRAIPPMTDTPPDGTMCTLGTCISAQSLPNQCRKGALASSLYLSRHTRGAGGSAAVSTPAIGTGLNSGGGPAEGDCSPALGRDTPTEGASSAEKDLVGVVVPPDMSTISDMMTVDGDGDDFDEEEEEETDTSTSDATLPATFTLTHVTRAARLTPLATTLSLAQVEKVLSAGIAAWPN